MTTFYRDGYKIKHRPIEVGGGLFRSGLANEEVTIESVKGLKATALVSPEAWADAELREFAIQDLIAHIKGKLLSSFTMDSRPFQMIVLGLMQFGQLTKEQAELTAMRTVDAFEQVYDERKKAFGVVSGKDN